MPTPAGHRERYLDVLRAVALLRVVVYHTYGYAWLTFVFPSMGVMFALAGSLTAASMERYAAYRVVYSRVRRLLPSLWLLALIVVPVMFWHGWPLLTEGRPFDWLNLAYWILPVLDPPASAWGAATTQVLWYVRAYLWFVLLSPAGLLLFRRWPVATTVAPLAVVVATALPVLNVERLGSTGPALLDFGTYGACWMLGFAHRAGMIRRIPLPALFGLAAGAMLLGASWALTHPDPVFGYDLNEIPLAQALWCPGAVLVLLRWSPGLTWLDRVPVLGRLVTVVNARALTVYLWHNIAIELAVPVNDRLGLYDPWQLFATAWALIAVAVLAFGWVEDIAARRRPRLLPGHGRPDRTVDRRLRRTGGLRLEMQGTYGATAGAAGDGERPAVQPGRPQAHR